MKKKQTQAERKNIMISELERVRRELARQNRTDKRRSISWMSLDLDTGDVVPPPNVLRVVK